LPPKDNFGRNIVIFFVFFLLFGLAASGIVFLAKFMKPAETIEVAKKKTPVEKVMTDPNKEKAMEYSLTKEGSIKVRQIEEPKPVPVVDDHEPAEKVAAKKEVKKAEIKKAAPEKKPEPAKIVKKEPVKVAKAEPVKKRAIVKEPEKKSVSVKKKAEVKQKMVQQGKRMIVPRRREMQGLAYVLQLKALREKNKAISETHRLRKYFPDIYLMQITTTAGSWYRIRCCGRPTYDGILKEYKRVSTRYTLLKPMIVKTGFKK